MANQMVCVTDYEERAEGLLDKRAWNQISTGADDEQTLKHNVTDFKRLRLRPRMMVDVSDIDLSTTILGEVIDVPICVAPTGQHRFAHSIGEVGTARAAESMKTCLCLSTGSNCSIEEVAEAAPTTLKWFQVYVCKNRELTVSLVQRAENAGFKALVVTVDLPVVGNRRRAQRDNYPPQKTAATSFGNFKGLVNDWDNNQAVLNLFDGTLTWKDITWLTTLTRLPVVAKGIVTGHDAVQALKAGCRAIYVSNHGGRQLDGVSSTILALEEVVKAVDGRAEVYMDCGIRCGTDVIKALALGARAVFIGRPILWGLSVAGEDGARTVLEILKRELKLAMQLCGVTSVNDVPRSLVVTEPLYSRL